MSRSTISTIHAAVGFSPVTCPSASARPRRSYPPGSTRQRLRRESCSTVKTSPRAVRTVHVGRSSRMRSNVASERSTRVPKGASPDALRPHKTRQIAPHRRFTTCGRFNDALATAIPDGVKPARARTKHRATLVIPSAAAMFIRSAKTSRRAVLELRRRRSVCARREDASGTDGDVLSPAQQAQESDRVAVGSLSPRRRAPVGTALHHGVLLTQQKHALERSRAFLGDFSPASSCCASAVPRQVNVKHTVPQKG